MGGFFHGVEQKEVTDGFISIQQVPTAVVAIIGTSPIGPVNEPTIVLGDEAAAQFGPDMAGFTIPQALLASIIDHGAGTAIVVNVLDPEEHKSTVATGSPETVTFNATTKRATLANPAVSNLVLKDSTGATTYELDEDYTLDLVTGDLEWIAAGAVPTAPKATYDYLDPTLVTSTDIIGAVNAGGHRTGLQALLNTYSQFGIKAKILIAPVFCTQSAVRAELDILAEKLGGICLVDAPIGTTVQQALEGRGPAGTINFNVSSYRTVPCYPHWKAMGPDGQMRLEPYSQRAAGVICLNDVQRGYWYSPSNRPVQGVLGLERPISGSHDDRQGEANQLNAAGIMTALNTYGNGLRTWGNRSSAFPGKTDPKTFINVLRTSDVINESISMASAQFSDDNITPAFIDYVLGSINEFLRSLIGLGAILDGRCWYDPKKNPVGQLAAGNIVFCYDFMPPTPAELMTFQWALNVNYLRNLAPSAA